VENKIVPFVQTTVLVFAIYWSYTTSTIVRPGMKGTNPADVRRTFIKAPMPIILPPTLGHLST
jgi:hypothetical protein